MYRGESSGGRSGGVDGPVGTWDKIADTCERTCFPGSRKTSSRELRRPMELVSPSKFSFLRGELESLSIER